MGAGKERFLQPELLAKLANMELKAATVVEGMMGGLHQSPFRGLSIEFTEYRRYQPGDEPRKIDWKAYARSDKYYIKEFEDETNLDAYIILDASASMGFGTTTFTKWQYGSIIASSLAYILQGQKDGIGLVVLDETVRLEMQPKNTRGHLIQVIGALENTKPSRKTRLAEVLHQAAGKINRKSMVLVISDLLDDTDEVVNALRHLQFGGNDVVVFQTLDEAELRFSFEGPTHFIDPESSAMVPALAQDVKVGYLETMDAFLKNYSEELGKTNIAYNLADTSKPLDEALFDFLSHGVRK
jgi:uncharacterized protein (DUF58 family)